MNETKNRAAGVFALLGLWLIALPLTFGYKAHPVEISDLICGALFIILALLSVNPKRKWSGWLAGIVGVWLQLAPLVFWAPSSLMYINDTLVGAIAIVTTFILRQSQESINAPSLPQGWSYNPSNWSHRIPTTGLATLCWFFSRYMAAYQLGYIDQMWDPFFHDGTLHVITSKISKSFPVSDAGMGAVCYTLEALLGWQGSARRWASTPWLVFAFAFLVIPVGIVSILLIILQPVAVGFWCSWCLATAASMLLMIVLTAGELAAALQFLRTAGKSGSSRWRVFWKGERAMLAPLPAQTYAVREKRLIQGVSTPWNLLLCAALGICLMASPSLLKIEGLLATMEYILGPLIVATSVIACAEVFRAFRYLNMLWGLGLLIAPWVQPAPLTLVSASPMALGVIVIALSIRKGRVSERYGAWEKLIV